MKMISNWTTALASMSVLVLGVLATSSAQAQTFTTLHSFAGTDGINPNSGLVQGTDGNLYGTTSAGGANGDGTAFKITLDGAVTTLHSFDGTDGVNPAGLIQATNREFYGTTGGGGANGDGTVFKMTRTGDVTTLHSFDGTDGTNPNAVLLQASNGYFYGTTAAGGANDDGTVFQMTLSGALTTLHSFDGTDGSNPSGGLIEAQSRIVFGTTKGGGTHGLGSIFNLTLSGVLSSEYSFAAGLEEIGSAPVGLVQVWEVNTHDLYGTTSATGVYGAGTVYKMLPLPQRAAAQTGSFGINGMDGSDSVAALIQGSDQALYGTTAAGGAYGYGTVFNAATDGDPKPLHSFNVTDGESPSASLVQGTNGDFYGTTTSGGANGYGTVFRLSMGFGPFVKTQPTFGDVGAAVEILGSDLTGATSVTFNGIAAEFTVVSKFLITTTVPTGATTGIVEVAIGTAILKSNRDFAVPTQ
jgi:uncharacterized repeat protein (TIGR03803 family)